MTIETTANDAILATTRTRMWDTLDQLRALRNRPVSPELVDQIDALQLESTRLARRLRVLGEPGILTMQRARLARPAQLVCEAVAEVEAECARRTIGIAIEPSLEPERGWLPAESTIEAIRSLLDAALATTAAHGTIVARIAEDKGTVRITITHDGPTLARPALDTPSDDDDTLSESDVVRGLVERIGGHLEQDSATNGATLGLPARGGPSEGRSEERDSSPWIFPVPTAA